MSVTTNVNGPEAGPKPVDKLAELASLGGSDIATSFATDLGTDLHRLFDGVSDAALPIYFGPLLGRLYLEGL